MFNPEKTNEQKLEQRLKALIKSRDALIDEARKTVEITDSNYDQEQENLFECREFAMKISKMKKSTEER